MNARIIVILLVVSAADAASAWAEINRIPAWDELLSHYIEPSGNVNTHFPQQLCIEETGGHRNPPPVAADLAILFNCACGRKPQAYFFFSGFTYGLAAIACGTGTVPKHSLE